MRQVSLVVGVRRSVRLVAVIALLAASASVTAQTPATPPVKPAPASEGMRMDMGKGGMTMGAGEGDMRSAMMKSMKDAESMKMSGNADRDFASMMKVHHQGAIDMAQLELKNGKDAKMRSLAKRVIGAQQKEIKEIDRWLAGQK